MAARPCPISLCVCPSQDSPITNISAEAPDPLLFWGQIWNPYNNYKNPPLGDGLYVKVDCGVFNEILTSFEPVIYAGSQLEANLQALAASLNCPWPSNGDEIFINDEQTQSVQCADGSTTSYTVDAGTLTSPPMDAELGAAWVEWANAWAAAYAYALVSQSQICLTLDPPPPDAPPIPPLPPISDPPSYPPPAHRHGPDLAGYPGWICLGESLFDEDNTYRISNPNGLTFTFAITGGGLAPGTYLEQLDGLSCVIRGTPTLPGCYQYTISATSVSLPHVTVQVTDELDVLGIANNPNLPDADICDDYAQQIVVIGCSPPYRFSGSIDMPGWMHMSTAGMLSGTPQSTDGPADHVFFIAYKDDNGHECGAELHLHVNACPTVSITPTALDNGVVGQSYFAQVFATGLTAPITWAWSGGPSGLILSASTGQITGTPDTPGTTAFDVFATDVCGCSGTAVCSITIGIVGNAALDYTGYCSDGSNPTTVHVPKNRYVSTTNPNQGLVDSQAYADAVNQVNAILALICPCHITSMTFDPLNPRSSTISSPDCGIHIRVRNSAGNIINYCIFWDDVIMSSIGVCNTNPLNVDGYCVCLCGVGSRPAADTYSIYLLVGGNEYLICKMTYT